MWRNATTKTEFTPYSPFSPGYFLYNIYVKIDISDDPFVKEYVEGIRKSNPRELLVRIKRRELLRNYRMEKGLCKPMTGGYRFYRIGLVGGLPAKKKGGNYE